METIIFLVGSTGYVLGSIGGVFVSISILFQSNALTTVDSFILWFSLD